MTFDSEDHESDRELADAIDQALAHASLEVRITCESAQWRSFLVNLVTGEILLDAGFVSRKADPDEPATTFISFRTSWVCSLRRGADGAASIVCGT